MNTESILFGAFATETARKIHNRTVFAYQELAYRCDQLTWILKEGKRYLRSIEEYPLKDRKSIADLRQVFFQNREAQKEILDQFIAYRSIALLSSAILGAASLSGCFLVGMGAIFSLYTADCKMQFFLAKGADNVLDFQEESFLFCEKGKNAMGNPQRFFRPFASDLRDIEERAKKRARYFRLQQQRKTISMATLTGVFSAIMGVISGIAMQIFAGEYNIMQTSKEGMGHFAKLTGYGVSTLGMLSVLTTTYTLYQEMKKITAS